MKVKYKGTVELGAVDVIKPIYRASTRPRGYKISCSAQLSRRFFLLINVKMPSIVGIFTFMRRKNGIIGLHEPEKAGFFILYLLEIDPRKRGIDVGAILGWVGNDIAIIAILL